MYWLGAVEPKAYRRAIKRGEALPSLHSPFFAPDAARSIDTGVQAMTAAARDLLAPAR